MKIPIESLPDRVAFCDPASGTATVKKTRARSAIALVTQDWLERIFTLFVWADRTSTDKLYEKIFWVNEHFSPTVFGIEANAMQSVFADGLRREARQRNVKVPFLDVWQPTRIQKPFRNRSSLQTPINDYRLFIPLDWHDTRHEIGTHPMNPVCDIVDAVASAIALLPKRPALARQDLEEIKYAKYLRRAGCSPDMIEQQLQAHRLRRGGNSNARSQEPFAVP